MIQILYFQIIQVKSRVVQLYRATVGEREEAQPREDYDDACELLIDEFCELEKNVNVSLLHLVVEFFKETTEPLENLVKKALYADMVWIFTEVLVKKLQDVSE